MPGAADRMTGARRAFTLIEMLIVIGIIMIFLALSIGAVMRTPAVNKLIGTEQLMSDMIRQARDTARSTGSPVQILISKANRTVSGVSQVPVWNETFETAPAGTTAASPWAMQADVTNNLITALGQTGQGLLGSTAMAGTPPASYPLLPSQSLARNTTTIDGFYLACAILPPDPQAPYYTYPDGTPTPDIIPLVQIGDEDDSNALCGLALVLKNTNIQSVTTIATATPANATIPADTLSWDLVGWINDSNGYHMVSSIGNSIANTISPSFLPAGGLDVTGPIVGNRWEDVGLLYDGHELQLYRNGQKVAQVFNADTDANSGNFSTQPKNASYCGGSLFVGRGNFTQLYNKGILPGTLPDPTGANPPLTVVPPTQQRYLVGTLDNARLLRLGTDRTASLPSGVTPDGDYAFTIRPDGVVETTMAAGTASNSQVQMTLMTASGSGAISTVNVTSLGATITFQLMGEVAAGANGQNLDTAVVTIDSDGTVDMNTSATTHQINTGVRTGGVSP